MKKLLSLAVTLFVVIAFISVAEAINVDVAEVQNSLAFVKGGKAAKNAVITWESATVATANKNGGFNFLGQVPADCVGTLSDGVSSIEVVVLDCTPLSVAPALVPKTGQTTTYGVGDDGALLRGVPLPTPRFVDNSDGTITDKLTGLIWLKNANCAKRTTPVGNSSGSFWPQVVADVISLNSFGTINGNDCGDTSNGNNHQSDWRMPNIRELHSLVHFGYINPALSNAAGTGQANATDPFSNYAISRAFWSSTNYEFAAWVVSFADGDIFTYDKNDEGGYYLLAVRGGS